MFFVAFILGIITFGLLWLHWYQKNSHFGKLIKQFPQDSMVPLIGHVINLSLNPDILYTQLRKINSSFNETFVLWSGHRAGLNIIRADDAEIILTSMKHIEKGFIYNFIKPWLGDGLLINTGSKWQHRRKMLTPTFHFNILRRFVNIMGEHSNSLIQKIKNEECKKERSNVIPLITDTALKMICETAMGTKLDENNKYQSKYIDALYSITPIIVQRVLSPWFFNDIMFSLSPAGIKQKTYLKTLHNFTVDVIKQREKNFNESDVTDITNSNDDDLGIKKNRFAMLDLLISAKNRSEINFEGIREEVDTFMFEGHDTTTMGLCLALFTLAHHKEIQNKIIAELDAIFGNDDRNATYEDLQNMKYLELCIKESLRLYPSVPLITRNLNEDTQLTNHVAPAGSEILIHIYDIHRDPKYFPDPEKFDPNRFLPENSKERHPYTYIPFSAGPRNCIGQKFAMLEMKSVLSSVFRNFTVDPISSVDDIKMSMGVILRVNAPVNVKFHEREM